MQRQQNLLIYKKHIILLTDGMVDIDRDPAVNTRERNRILDEVLPLYQQAGFKIHTIALSDNADKHLMERLSLGTDAKSSVANDADALMKVFLAVFNQAVPQEELPFNGDPFFTDSSIEEFTALIFRTSPETTLLLRINKNTHTSRTAPMLVGTAPTNTILSPLNSH